MAGNFDRTQTPTTPVTQFRQVSFIGYQPPVNRLQMPLTPTTQMRGPFVDVATFNRFQGPVPATIRYVMRGEDATIAGKYDTWISTLANGDFSATQYTGTLNLPLRDVVVQSKG